MLIEHTGQPTYKLKARVNDFHHLSALFARTHKAHHIVGLYSSPGRKDV